MNISKEAVEAAARAAFPSAWEEAEWRNAWHAESYRAHMKWARKRALDQARAALEAAAPLLVAQTLREAADDAFKDKSTQGLARAVIGNWLRMKVAKIEEGL